MKRLDVWLMAGLLVAVIALATSDQRARARGKEVEAARQQVTLWQAKYSEESSRLRRVDTVWRAAKTRYDTVRMSVPTVGTHVPDTGTVPVRVEYIRVADSTVQACSELANICRHFRLTADSIITAQRSLIASQDAVLQAGRHWTRRFGLCVGYGITQDRLGVQVGVCARIWP